jgi:hypothetical protein
MGVGLDWLSCTSLVEMELFNTISFYDKKERREFNAVALHHSIAQIGTANQVKSTAAF